MKSFKILIALVCITIALVTVMFCWNEEIDTSKKVNDQKISNFFVLIFSIVGTVAALHYTKKQYELSVATILPDLFPAACTFMVTETSNPVGLTREGKLNYVFPIETLSEKKAQFEIVNKGVGVAKKINIQWIFDQADIERIVERKYELLPIPIKVDENYIDPGLTSKFDLPITYLPCCGPKIIEGETVALSNIKSANVKERLPDLNLIVTYSDIQGKEFKKSFVVDVLIIKQYVLFNFSAS